MAANENRTMALVVFSLCLTAVALGHNAPTVRWGHQMFLSYPSLFCQNLYFLYC